MPSVVGLLEQREPDARRRVDELREEADRIQAELALAEREWMEWAIARALSRRLRGWDDLLVDRVGGGCSVGTVAPSYKGHRYPVEVISHCVWLYHRFPLSFREVEELMLERGIVLSYETVRRRCAKFAGDSRYAPKTAESRVYTKVRVSTTPSRHYKTNYAWNHTYYYFRQSVDPLFTTSMTYYPGREYRVQVQAYYDGAWRTTATEYLELQSGGVGAVVLTGTPSTGIRFRIRSSYIDTSAGDNVNTTTHGAWKHFVFTS